MSSGLFKNVTYKPFHLQIIFYLYKQDLALDKQQSLFCHKTKLTNLVYHYGY